MPVTPRSLAALPLGAEAVVRRVWSVRPIARRLMELGLVPGTKVSVTRVAPLGDPLELLVRGASLSIRRADAALVRVVPAAPSPAKATLPSSVKTAEPARGALKASPVRGAQ